MEKVTAENAVRIQVAGIDADSRLAGTEMQVSGSIYERQWTSGIGVMELWEKSTQNIMANGGTPEAIQMNDAHYMNLIEMASGGQMTFPTLGEDRWR
jgi:hypothetical protein